MGRDRSGDKKKGHRRRRRRKGGARRGGGGRSDGSRSRSYSRSRSRSRRRGAGGGGGGAVGKYGCGDHRQDLETFVSKNQLEARVAHALRTMNENDQKNVMGTDGGENSFMLIDRAKNPNGVVMSRIRKIEGGRK